MENQRQISSDRISSLPEDIIAKILSHMPVRDALRTSILSKKWRYCWTRMPKLVLDEKLVNVSSDIKEIHKYKLVNAIFHVLLLRRAPILEFRLSVNTEFFSEIDQIILHLSWNNNIKKFMFNNWETDSYLIPCSFFKMQGLEHLLLIFCIFDPPSMFNGFGMLKSLRLYDVEISAETLQRLLTNCPLLEGFTLIRDDLIELTELFKSLPSIQVLEISELRLEHFKAGGMPHKLPTSLVHLRILELKVCFLELSSVLYVISSSPNLEKIKLYMCYDHTRRCNPQTFKNLLDDEDCTGLNLDHLKELEIIGFRNHALEMEFVKLIMAKSPMLKKARIELDSDVSLDEENKMLRDMVNVPFPRASPTANFIIKSFRGKEIYPS